MSQVLPDSLQTLADVIGEGSAIQLAHAAPKQGGRSVLYVPRNIAPDSWISQAIGHVLADKLQRYFTGELMFLASGAARRIERDALIIEAFRNGEPLETVAAAAGVTTRHARRITAGTSENDRVRIHADYARNSRSPSFPTNAASYRCASIH